MNWGTKLMIGMGLFMAFIVVLVYKMVTSPEDAMIDKNYYEKGQAYDTVYNAKQRAIQEGMVPKIEVNQNGLSIVFSQPADYKLICKRPSDSKLDRQFEGKLAEDFTIYIPKEDLKAGPWKINLEYTINGRNYLVEREITMP